VNGEILPYRREEREVLGTRNETSTLLLDIICPSKTMDFTTYEWSMTL
jgi:hypothetical protein